MMGVLRWRHDLRSDAGQQQQQQQQQPQQRSAGQSHTNTLTKLVTQVRDERLSVFEAQNHKIDRKIQLFNYPLILTLAHHFNPLFYSTMQVEETINQETLHVLTIEFSKNEAFFILSKIQQNKVVVYIFTLYKNYHPDQQVRTQMRQILLITTMTNLLLYFRSGVSPFVEGARAKNLRNPWQKRPDNRATQRCSSFENTWMEKKQQYFATYCRERLLLAASSAHPYKARQGASPVYSSVNLPSTAES